MSDIDQPQTDPQSQERSAYPSPFGRGWIPEERDIGLPGEARRAGGGGIAGLTDEAGRIWLRSPEDVAVFLKEAGLDEEEAGVSLPHGDAAGCDCAGEGEGLAPNPSRMREASSEGDPCAMREGREDVAFVRADAFTPVRQVRFLDALANLGSVRSACFAARVSAECVYRLRRRDAAFARGWAAALVLAREAAGEALADRAMNGIKEAVFHQGKVVGVRSRYDSRLLLAHVARLDKLATDHAAQDDAARFDELLSTIGGEPAYTELYIPGHCENQDAAYGPAPLLPCTRETYLEVREHRADIAYFGRSYLTKPPADPDAPPPIPPEEALAQAKAEWDGWHGHACRTVDAMVDEDTDYEARGDAEGDVGGDVAAAAGEPPMEFKSMDGANILTVHGEGDRDAQRRGGGGSRLDTAFRRSSPALRHPDGPLRQALRACHLPSFDRLRMSGGGEDRDAPRTVSTVSTALRQAQDERAASATVTPFQNAMRSRIGSASGFGSG